MTKDGEVRYTQAGKAVTSFTLAISKTYISNSEKKEDVSFICCVAFGKTAELVSQYVHKGDELAVRGELKQDRWQDQEGKNHSKINVIVEKVMFGNKAKYNQQAPQSQQEQSGMNENVPF